MPENVDSGPQPPLLEPKGELCFVLFDGVLSGPAPEPHQLRQALKAFNDASEVSADIEIDAGGFSILLDDRPVPAKDMTDETREAVNDLLTTAIQLASGRGLVESTLRCTEVYSESVRESLFATRNNEIELVSRLREVTHNDLRRGPVPQALLPAGISRRRACAIFLCLILAAIAVAMQSGYFNRLRSAEASSIKFDAGAFRDSIDLTMTSKWGNYIATLKRGEGYPTDTSTPDGLTPSELAARRRVTSGAHCFVILENADGKALGWKSVTDLSPLLEEKEVTVELPGHPQATRCRLALSAPEKEN